MQFIELLGEVVWDRMGPPKDLQLPHFLFKFVSHCLHSCQTNSVCSITSIRLGEFGTQLPRPVSSGGLLLCQQVKYYFNCLGQKYVDVPATLGWGCLSWFPNEFSNEGRIILQLLTCNMTIHEMRKWFFPVWCGRSNLLESDVQQVGVCPHSFGRLTSFKYLLKISWSHTHGFI